MGRPQRWFWIPTLQSLCALGRFCLGFGVSTCEVNRFSLLGCAKRLAHGLLSASRMPVYKRTATRSVRQADARATEDMTTCHASHGHWPGGQMPDDGVATHLSMSSHLVT